MWLWESSAVDSKSGFQSKHCAQPTITIYLLQWDIFFSFYSTLSGCSHPLPPPTSPSPSTSLSKENQWEISGPALGWRLRFNLTWVSAATGHCFHHYEHHDLGALWPETGEEAAALLRHGKKPGCYWILAWHSSHTGWNHPNMARLYGVTQVGVESLTILMVNEPYLW